MNTTAKKERVLSAIEESAESDVKSDKNYSASKASAKVSKDISDIKAEVYKNNDLKVSDTKAKVSKNNDLKVSDTIAEVSKNNDSCASVSESLNENETDNSSDRGEDKDDGLDDMNKQDMTLYKTCFNQRFMSLYSLLPSSESNSISLNSPQSSILKHSVQAPSISNNTSTPKCSFSDNTDALIKMHNSGVLPALNHSMTPRARSEWSATGAIPKVKKNMVIYMMKNV